MRNLNDCHNCTACDLASTRQRVVISRGSPTARLMLIGEAPGAREDALGEPFVGRSGQLLDRLLEDTGFDLQHDLYICNAVKCRPPQNRRPKRSELLACRWMVEASETALPGSAERLRAFNQSRAVWREAASAARRVAASECTALGRLQEPFLGRCFQVLMFASSCCLGTTKQR